MHRNGHEESFLKAEGKHMKVIYLQEGWKALQNATLLWKYHLVYSLPRGFLLYFVLSKISGQNEFSFSKIQVLQKRKAHLWLCYPAGRRGRSLEFKALYSGLGQDASFQKPNLQHELNKPPSASQTKLGRNTFRKVMKTLNEEELCHTAAKYSDENKDEI